MKEIRFTLGESDVWHTIAADFDMINELQTGQAVASIITNELNVIRNCKGKPKRVEIRDGNGSLMAVSKDILSIEEMEFK